MAEQHNGNGKAKWVAIGLPIIIAAVGVLGFFYGVGQRTNKIAEVVEWKQETAPRIERMDSQGTTSFKLFHDEYLRTQARQEAALIELEHQIRDKQLEDLRARLQTLERKP
jgi:flagellar basal body-associated protein FliL